MHCRYCGIDPDLAVIIPAHVDEGLGESPFACETCATGHGIYCQKHQTAHIGFEDGTHGCIRCSVETAARNEGLGEDLIMYLNSEFPADEVERIDEYLDQVDMGEGFPAPFNLMRVLAMIAQRAGLTLEETIEAFKRGKSAAPIDEGKLPTFEKPKEEHS